MLYLLNLPLCISGFSRRIQDSTMVSLPYCNDILVPIVLQESGYGVAAAAMTSQVSLGPCEQPA